MKKICDENERNSSEPIRSQIRGNPVDSLGRAPALDEPQQQSVETHFCEELPRKRNLTRSENSSERPSKKQKIDEDREKDNDADIVHGSECNLTSPAKAAVGRDGGVVPETSTDRIHDTRLEEYLSTELEDNSNNDENSDNEDAGSSDVFSVHSSSDSLDHRVCIDDVDIIENGAIVLWRLDRDETSIDNENAPSAKESDDSLSEIGF